MDKSEKYSWKSADISTKFQTGRSMSVTQKFSWSHLLGMAPQVPHELSRQEEFLGVLDWELHLKFPMKSQKLEGYR